MCGCSASAPNTQVGYARDIAGFLTFLWSSRGKRSWRDAAESGPPRLLVLAAIGSGWASRGRVNMESRSSGGKSLLSVGCASRLPAVEPNSAERLGDQLLWKRVGQADAPKMSSAPRRIRIVPGATALNG